MRFDVITLFPELFEPFLANGVTRRAFTSGQVVVRGTRVTSPRAAIAVWTTDPSGAVLGWS